MKLITMICTVICLSSTQNSLFNLAWAKERTLLKKVTLFGQPCSLEGPGSYSEATLLQIHQMGPDQVYPVTSILEPKKLRDEIKEDLNKLKLIKSPPSMFEVYLEKIKKKLNAQLLFIQNIPHIPKDSLIIRQSDFPPELFKNLQPILNQVSSLKPADKNFWNQLDLLFENYNEKLDTKPYSPEKEFHGVLEQLKIQYSCALDGSESSKSNLN